MSAPGPVEHTVCSECRIDGTCVNDPAPEPVEAEYDENGVPTDAYVDACIRAGGAEPIQDEAFRPPAPEPVEVPADELAAAERVARDVSFENRRPSVRELIVLMAEFDRRGILLAALMDGLSPWLRDGEPPAPDDDEIRASVDQMNDDFTEASNGWASARADLARALPVVEAAGAVVEHLESTYGPPVPGCEKTRLSQLLDTLARAVRSAREPRTGEGG